MRQKKTKLKCSYTRHIAMLALLSCFVQSSCCIDSQLHSYARMYLEAEAAYQKGNIATAKVLINDLECGLATNPRFLWHTSKSLKNKVKTLKEALEDKK